MGFQVSPGIDVNEITIDTVVPASSTTEGAICGTFPWGPIETRVLVDSETTLVNRFGKPTTDNFETFFSAANFLAYGNQLYTTRVGDSSSLNGVSSKSSVTTGVLVKNEDSFEASEPSSKRFVARYAGTLGNSLGVSICDTADKFYTANVSSANITAIAVGSKIATVDVNFVNVAATADYENLQKYDKIDVSGQIMEVDSINSTAVVFTSKYKGSADVSELPIERYWKHSDRVQGAPTTTEYTEARHANSSIVDEIHVVVEDLDGGITGVPGTILEVWEGLSRASDAKKETGDSNYYKDVINQQSAWVYTVDHASADANYSSNTAVNLLAVDDIAAGIQNEYQTFLSGADSADESTLTLGDLAVGYDLYKSGDDVDVSLILQGKAIGGTNGEGLANYIIDNIADVRKDCIAFVSPDRADVVNNAGSEVDDIITFRNSLTSTSYAFADSGYKYQYDKYNDAYRWVPLNGDIAGLVVRTENDRDAWYSPAGESRGQIKNVVKLAFSPDDKPSRNKLYQADINPVFKKTGSGHLLYGDKTLLGKQSTFSRIGVRRLFIVLEKSISKMAEATLFEFNDEFTQGRFKNTVEPYLRDIQGKRGIEDFQVVADGTNNTSEVLARNEFVGDIYIKPTYSINYITLNFVSVRSGVEFSEIVGSGF